MGNTIFHAIEHLHGVYYYVTHVPGLMCYLCTRFRPTLALSPQRVERGFLLWNTKVITSFRNSDEVGMSGIQEKGMIC
jgi:hypothetical protein